MTMDYILGRFSSDIRINLTVLVNRRYYSYKDLIMHHQGLGVMVFIFNSYYSLFYLLAVDTKTSANIFYVLINVRENK